MIALCRDCYTNKVVLKRFEVVDDTFCQWNTEAVYIGSVMRKKSIYNVYRFCGKMVACLQLE